jgi:mitochondrial import inner membrane translocase subunit TIM50
MDCQKYGFKRLGSMTTSNFFEMNFVRRFATLRPPNAVPSRLFSAKNLTSKKEPLISAEVMEMAQKKMGEKGFQQKPSDASTLAASEGSTLAAKLLTGGFLALVALGAYQLTKEVQGEPEDISNAPFYKKPFLRARYRILSMYKSSVDPDTEFLLPDAFPIGHPYFRNYTLLIELDKLLVYSKWTKEHGWSVAKRPWADYFLAYMSQFYEVVVFTSQSPSYAIPILDKLDGNMQTIFYRLYRNHTRYDISSGDYVKDLSILNRDLKRVILMDPDERHYKTTPPDNVIEMKPWEGDPKDTYLLDIIPFMETLAISGFEDVRPTLKAYKGKNIPKEFGESLARIQKEQRLEFEKKNASVAANGGFFGSLMNMLGFNGTVRVLQFMLTF